MATPSFEYFYNITWYTNSRGEKVQYFRYNIPFQVVGGKIELGEIPDSIYKIRITGMTEISLNGLIKTATIFKCNYNTGTLYFDSSQEGKFFNITFSAKGKAKYYAKNMILEDKNNVFASDNVEDALYEAYQRVNNLITSNPQPSEVQDARLDGATSVLYPTLKNRLDASSAENKNAKIDTVNGITYNTIQERLNKNSQDINTNTTDITTISGKIGNKNLADLTTVNKNSLVEAINENVVSIKNINDLVPYLAQKNISAINYYVNASSGSDTNNGLSSGTAFKTINKAISILPEIINYPIVINIADGIYNEDVYISGKIGNGSIKINGTSKANTLINYIECNQCTCQITLYNFATTTNKSDTIKIYRCSFVSVDTCQNNSAIPSYAFVTYNSGSNGWVKNCNPSYAYVGIQAMQGSEVLSDNNTGTGNTYSVYASSSIIYINGSIPSATYSQGFEYGGKVSVTKLSLSTVGYRINDDGTIEQWGTATLNTGATWIVFPIAFPNAVYNISITSVTSSPYATSYSDKTLGGFTGRCASATNVSCEWRAIGK